MAKIYRRSDTPRDAAMRSTVSPILLFGVDAPAVTPTVSAPLGNHPVTTCSPLAPTGRKRIAPLSGSMPGDVCPSKRHADCSPFPAASMYAHTSRASALWRTTRYFPLGYLVAWLEVAFVSSW